MFKDTETMTLTGFSGCDMIIYTDKNNKGNESGEGVAFQVQAITWAKLPDGTVAGSLVVCWAPNPISGPHNIIITCHGEDNKFATNAIYGVEIFEAEDMYSREFGEAIDWKDMNLEKAYLFKAQGYTGWINNR